jgi:phage recombination protein Bet
VSKTALAIADRTEPTAPVVTSEQLELVRKTVANGATDAELKLYLYDCARQGVHPLDRLIHFTKRGGKYTPVTSIDFMRMRAADSGEMAGSDDPLFTGEPIPLTATVTIYRLTQGQRFAYTATARWDEFKPDQDFMWRKMPHVMLGKCAEAAALRKAFPRQLAGLYAAEEMAQAGNSVSRPPDGVNLETGEVIEAPAPDGFDDWWSDFTATADNGLDALEAAWKASKPEFKKFASKTRRTVITDLKAKAARVAAS